MSRILPMPFGGSSGCAAGEADASWNFTASFDGSFGVSFTLGASASFRGSGFGATASFTGSSGTGDGATPCGEAAAKRSRKESAGSTGVASGASIVGGSTRATLWTEKSTKRRATGASKLVLPSSGYGLAAKILAYTVQPQPITRPNTAVAVNRLCEVTLRAGRLRVGAAN